MFDSIKRYFRKFQSFRKRNFVSTINHSLVISTMKFDGRLTPRYMFMLIISISIATIGIIVNIPSVVVGAMLISPLMSPIMLFGFSLCTVDFYQLKISAKAIITGVVISILSSYLIIKASPIREVTDQILSRSNPNLYDLLVAVFSGIAGAYTIITRKRAEIIGVALATSLMPPLAVVSFGLAIGRHDLSQGAAFLFLTNLLAISVSATILAKWYGFGFNNSTAQTLWQWIITSCVFISLSIPLGITLKQIAYEFNATIEVNAEINKYFHSNTKLNIIKTSFTNKNKIDANAVVFTDQYIPNAHRDIVENLEKTLATNINLTIEQVTYKEDISTETSKHLAMSKQEIADKIRSKVFFPIKNTDINYNNKTAIIYPAHSKNLKAVFLYESEQEIVKSIPGWKILIYPHVVQIPMIYFAVDSAELSKQEHFKLQVITWMLQRWQVSDVNIIGFAEPHDKNLKFNAKSLVGKRITTVLDYFKGNDINSSTMIARNTSSNKSTRTNYGIAAPQKIMISLDNKDLDLYLD